MIIVKVASVANIFVKLIYFEKAGDIMEGHTHNYDHLTLLAKGKVNVIVDGITTEFTAPNMIYINKDKVHTIVATVDETVVYCIHALRDNEGEILSDDMIPKHIRSVKETSALAGNIISN